MEQSLKIYAFYIYPVQLHWKQVLRVKLQFLLLLRWTLVLQIRHLLAASIKVI